MRCSKCLLPDSLAGSNFNVKNECYWCQTGFPAYEPKGNAKLKEFLGKYKSQKNSADCLVGLSGGKDSSYTLYKLVKEYGMKVEAFTYIHDGSTRFSIENAENLCKELGVKHHIVSINNQGHLKSFKSYFRAWLDNPTTVSAGMTCVACKHLHLLGSNIANSRNIPILVWSTSPLEYSPFLAIKVESDKSKPFHRQGIISSGMLMLKHAINSPKFTRSFIRHFKISLLGCLAVTPNSTFLKIRYPKLHTLMFYDYENWNPITIKQEISSKTGWKLPPEISEDWHSDCAFNIFKEYMFQKMMGVSYTDAFLSNQIRYGIITRNEAVQELRRSKDEFAHSLQQVLTELDMNDIKEEIDYSCFKVEVI